MLQKASQDRAEDFFPIDIPERPAGGIAVGKPGEAQWDSVWATDRHAILSVGETLQISVRLSSSSQHAAVRLLSNLEQGSGLTELSVLNLVADEAGIFHLKKTVPQAGRFVFFGQYTLDGRQWFWLRGEPLLLMAYPSQLCGLRMYIMIPNAAGHLPQWVAHLDQIASLGFNMVHLLPLTAQGLSQSPYAARDLFSIEPDLADPSDSRTPLQQWEDFVRAAQRRKLGLCLDLVLNHVAVDSYIATEHPEWIVPDDTEADGLKRAGFEGPHGWQSWRDLVLVNYSHPLPQIRTAIWSYFRRYALYWARYAAFTQGMIRLDNLHSTHPIFARNLTQELRAMFPQLGILGEYFSSHDAMRSVVQSFEMDLLLATPWEHHFAADLRRYLRYLHDTRHSIPWFCPVNSHDSGPPAQEFASVQATRPRYVISACLSVGATGLSQGVEHGLLHKINFIGRQPQISYASGHDFRSIIRIVNTLIINHACFRQTGGIRFIDSNHPAVIAAIRFEEDAQDEPVFIVMANLDIHQAQTLTIDLQDPLLRRRELFEVLSHQAVQVSSSPWQLQLEPCGTRIIRASLVQS